ncbi:MAG: DUF1404 family protein [Candidatus Nitrosopolaris sp.]
MGKSKTLVSPKTIYLLFLLSVMTTFANFAYAQPSENGTQFWTDTENNVKILFTYSPNPVIDTKTVLKFSVSNLLTGNHLKNMMAMVVIITNSTGQERIFKFNKLYAPNGDFSVKYLFPDSGIYQVITRINSNNPPSIMLATFTVIVTPETSFLSIIITIAIIIAIIVGSITNFIRTKHRRQSNYLIVAAFGILILISIQPALLEFTERDLAYHMVLEHTLFFVLGALSIRVAEIILKLLVSSNNNRKGHLKFTLILFWTKLLRKIFTVNRYGYVWLILAAGLLTFWHIPSVFDFAELHEQIHVAQHVSFILVGAMGFLATRSLGESFKLFALFALNGIMGFAGLMFSVLDKPIYLVYSVSSHNNAGTWMLVVCIILLVIVLPSYLIHRTLLHVRIKLTSSNSRPSQNSSG